MASFVTYVTTTLLSFGLIILAKLYQNYQWKRKYNLPPGPPGLPYFGNLFQVPSYHQGPWAQALAARYGEMFTLEIASKTWVFLNSSRLVTELLEKRSALYSSRPSYPYTSTLLSGGCRMVLQPYGPQWRRIRRIMHSILSKANAHTFAPFQDLESKQLLFDVLHKPEDWFLANQRFANSVVMSVIFGKRCLSANDENMRGLFESSLEFIMAQQIGANWADTIPWLASLPNTLQWWRKRGLEGHKRVLAVYTREIEDLKRRMDEGCCPPCFATRFLSEEFREDRRVLGEKQTTFVMGSLIEAGSDTSRMMISQVIAAAASDGRWVKEAQKELDTVCGRAARLPTFADRKNLPYLSAVVKEGFRWRPFSEIGVPHMLDKDGEFEGWKFPAGTVFTWNAWAIALSESEYEDPERFWPDRWLRGEDKRGKVEDPLFGQWAFGAGRRVCTGYHVGDTNVWIAAARLLYCFDFEEVEGQRIDTLNMNVAEHWWAPFPVNIKVRSEAHRALIERVGREMVCG